MYIGRFGEPLLPFTPLVPLEALLSPISTGGAMMMNYNGKRKWSQHEEWRVENNVKGINQSEVS
jgi:hypothetical protein